MNKLPRKVIQIAFKIVINYIIYFCTMSYRAINIKIRNSISGRVIILFFLFILLIPAFSEKYTNTIFNISANSKANILIVDKSKQMLFVKKRGSTDSVEQFEKFRITTGKVYGNKEKAGDLKTPEGIYYIVGKILGSKLPEKYGPLAFVLNYPNPVDRIFGRTGSNIWIHGRNEEIVDRQTEGCISLENNYILNLAPFITINKTPVIIVDSLENLNEVEYQQEIRMWDNIMQSWSNAWETGDTLTYFHFYSSFFKDESGRGLKFFKNRKKVLEALYEWKKITIDNIVVLSSEYEARVQFNQKYYCPKFYSSGVKTLTFVPVDSAWEIVKEQFTSAVPRVYVNESIKRFIKSWESAWESRNIENYISFYDSSFSAKGLSLQEWYQYKRRVFDQTDNVYVELSSPKICSLEKIIWEVSFKQDYQSDSHNDIGQKILTVCGYPGNFRILKEEWSTLEKNEKN